MSDSKNLFNTADVSSALLTTDFNDHFESAKEEQLSCCCCCCDQEILAHQQNFLVEENSILWWKNSLWHCGKKFCTAVQIGEQGNLPIRLNQT